MLDIVQSFTLLSYCIVSPIYISPICNVEIHYYEKIKLGILYFSLFTSFSQLPHSKRVYQHKRFDGESHVIT